MGNLLAFLAVCWVLWHVGRYCAGTVLLLYFGAVHLLIRFAGIGFVLLGLMFVGRMVS